MDDLNSIIEHLEKLIGVEHRLDEVNYALKFAVRGVRPAAVGAHHIVCSDETERPCAESFQRCLVADMIPRLKPGCHSAFRTANLGARYEWHSLRIAEEHFATPMAKDSFKVLVVKLNSHVAACKHEGKRTYGDFCRYKADSTACGSLHALMAGAQGPFADELRSQFNADGLERLKLLNDVVPDEVRSLSAAILCARLQARSAALDAQDHKPASPTVYLIVSAVTLNTMEADDELLCGLYLIDRRKGKHEDVYRGLGDDPTEYRIEHRGGKLHVSDGNVQTVRQARDHRELIGKALRESGQHKLTKDARVNKILESARVHSDSDRNAQIARVAAKGLLLLLAETSPVTAALLLFAQGASGIYHAHRAHQLARDMGNTARARRMLVELHERIDSLPPDEARNVLEVLKAGYEAK